MKWVWLIVPVLIVVVPMSAFGLLRVDGMGFILTGGLAVLAGCIAIFDRWAGTFAAYVLLRWLTPPSVFGLETVAAIVFGIGLLVSAQYIPDRWKSAAKLSVSIAAVVQVLLAICQHYHYDPLWLGFTPDPDVHVHGTLGNPMYMGAFVAISTGIVPIALLPVMFVGVFLSKSATAGLAFALAPIFRWRRQWRYTVPLAIASLGLVLWTRTLVTWTWVHRAAVWTVALQEWVRWTGNIVTWLWKILLGFGPAAWMRAWPRVGPTGAYEIFLQAHNEYIQILFEGGLVGVLLVAGWVWSHRKQMWRSEWLPAAVALAVIAVGFFPFQVSGTAVLSLLVLGMVSRGEMSDEKDRSAWGALDPCGGFGCASD